MRRVDFKVPIYDWNITIVTIYDSNDAEDIKKLMDEFSLPERDMVLRYVADGSYNGGRTYDRKARREEVVILFPWDSEESFFKTLNHEKRHMVDAIVKWHNLECDESAAYLDGFISGEIYKHLNELK